MTDLSDDTASLICQVHCFDEHDAGDSLVEWPSLGMLLAARGRDQSDQIFMRYFDDEPNLHACYCVGSAI